MSGLGESLARHTVRLTFVGLAVLAVSVAMLVHAVPAETHERVITIDELEARRTAIEEARAAGLLSRPLDDIGCGRGHAPDSVELTRMLVEAGVR